MESAAEPQPVRLLALGDSYTVGESVTPAEAWPRQLAARLTGLGWRIEPTIIATTAWTSGELLAVLDRDPPTGSFDLVSVQIGVNDQYRGLPLDELAANAGSLLERARGWRGGEPGGVFVVSIPDWGVTPYAGDRDRRQIAREIDRFNRAWRQIAEEAGVPFVDVTTISRWDPRRLAADGLHPSGEQYRLWVEAISPVAAALLTRLSG